MEVTSTSNAEHFRWGEDCDGWHLLADDTLNVLEERMGPSTAEERHRHPRSRQFFYVLDGEINVEVDAAQHRLGRGEGLHVPPGAAHQVRNDGSTDARFLVISTPNSHGPGERVPSPLNR